MLHKIQSVLSARERFECIKMKWELRAWCFLLQLDLGGLLELVFTNQEDSKTGFEMEKFRGQNRTSD
jgi:hypothetical protein